MRISNLTAYKNIESFKLCFNFAQPSTARISDFWYMTITRWEKKELSQTNKQFVLFFL